MKTARAAVAKSGGGTGCIAAKPADDVARRLLLQKQHQDLIRRNFDALPRLFTELTGLQFRVCWTPAHPISTERGLARQILGSCSIAKAAAGTTAWCARCAQKHVAAALQSGQRGHQFTCPFGIWNFWSPLQVQDLCVGLALLQCREGSRPRTRGGARSDRLLAGFKRATAGQRARAVRLLKLMVHDVVETDLAQVEEAELTQVQRSVLAHEKQEQRLRRELQRAPPVAYEKAPSTAGETHTQQIVHRMLDYIHQHYHEPLELKQLAADLTHNPAYLSDLFTRTVGQSFRKYLTAFRLDKAKELLDDPAKSIAEVAYAVGSTDPNQFRRAFKNQTGFAPAAWRDSLRT